MNVCVDVSDGGGGVMSSIAIKAFTQLRLRLSRTCQFEDGAAGRLGPEGSEQPTELGPS